MQSRSIKCVVCIGGDGMTVKSENNKKESNKLLFKQEFLLFGDEHTIVHSQIVTVAFTSSPLQRLKGLYLRQVYIEARLSFLISFVC